jgi:tetratricopeptide (TPR) repeat protein
MHRRAYLGASLALRYTRRYAEADAVLLAASLYYPDDFEIDAAYAWVAHSAQDWDEAATRWQRVRARHPQNVAGHICGALSLRAGGRRAAADEILEQARSLFPDNADVLIQYAWTAHIVADWPEANRRWHSLRQSFPDQRDGYAFGAAALRDAGDFAAAEALFEASSQKFPADPELAVQRAMIPAARRDWDLAVAQWEAVRARFPDRPEGFIFGGQALLEKHQFDAAEQLLLQGIDRFPDNVEVAIEHAWVAHRRQFWAQAQKRWQRLLQRYPDDIRVRDGANQLQRDMELAAQAVPAGGAIDAVEHPATSIGGEQFAPHELMSRFASLGDDCAFGMIQRHFGVESLDLLPWANIDPESLVTALENNFAGVGVPENARLELNQAGEWVLVHGTWFEMATFCRQGDVDEATLLPRVCRRLALLRDRLLQDLAEGTKIFVYQRTQSSLRIDQAQAIVAAVRRHGPGRLLWVQQASAEHRAGTVVQLDDRLLSGFVEQLPQSSDPLPTPFNTWLAVCRQAIAIQAASG